MQLLGAKRPEWHGAGLLGGRFHNFETPIPTNVDPMNAVNALVFAAFGAVMEFLPKAFPSWFPPARADQDSARALWLALMGAVQIALGVGFLVRVHVVPVAYRLFSLIPSGSGTLALPSPRGVNVR